MVNLLIRLYYVTRLRNIFLETCLVSERRNFPLDKFATTDCRFHFLKVPLHLRGPVHVQDSFVPCTFLVFGYPCLVVPGCVRH